MSMRFQELYNSKSLLDAVCPRLVGFLSDINALFSLLLDCEGKEKQTATTKQARRFSAVKCNSERVPL
jgi:hypothetical protein